jgi:hypothetical protein
MEFIEVNRGQKVVGAAAAGVLLGAVQVLAKAEAWVRGSRGSGIGSGVEGGMGEGGLARGSRQEGAIDSVGSNGSSGRAGLRSHPTHAITVSGWPSSSCTAFTQVVPWFRQIQRPRA